jgi:hypothetical protein
MLERTFGMQGSLKLGRVAGIETRVHYTWLFSSPHTVIVGGVSSITRGAPALSINDFVLGRV